MAKKIVTKCMLSTQPALTHHLLVFRNVTKSTFKTPNRSFYLKTFGSVVSQDFNVLAAPEVPE